MNGSAHTDAAPQLQPASRVWKGSREEPLWHRKAGGRGKMRKAVCRIRSSRTTQELQTLVQPLLLNIISPLSLSIADPSLLAVFACFTL